MKPIKHNADNISLKDVAKAAGVSVATVSKALNKGSDYKRISSECIERIEKAAASLGYRPNYHAQSLKRQSSKTIGFVSNISDADSFWGNITYGIQKYLSQQDCSLLLIKGYQDSGKIFFEKGLIALQERQVDSLIITGFSINDDNIKSLLSVEQPIVIIEYQNKIKHPVVALDSAPGLLEAALHLKGLGHKEILWLGMIHEKELYPHRRAIFKNACKNHKLNLHERMAIVKEDIHWYNFERKINDLAESLAEALPEKRFPFTAAVCYNEVVALALYRHLNEKGMKIPQDFSVIGFDDLYSSHSLPPMSVVSHKLKEIGFKAAELALQAHREPQLWKELYSLREEVPSELVIRLSTGPCP